MTSTRLKMSQEGLLWKTALEHLSPVCLHQCDRDLDERAASRQPTWQLGGRISNRLISQRSDVEFFALRHNYDNPLHASAPALCIFGNQP